ncbi:MAG: UDP-N-acetylmuramate dehydrogenase [Bacteroidaceae bacterium]|nr:UDP-N-acetylmuramate dehydrogenase [Bacteroidaceae bacterium]
MLKHSKKYQLLSRNTFGIEAVAENFVEFSNEEELLAFLDGGFDDKLLVIGGGSNLLFVNDFHGTVFHSAIKGVELVSEDNESVLLRVGSGVNWDELVEYTVSQGWGGLENLSAIPGEVGASAVQNVGAYGREAGELITKVETIAIADASKHIFLHDDCDFSYRHSIFKAAEKGKHIITYVTYRLSKQPQFKLAYGNLNEKVEELGGATLANVRKAVCMIRNAKLPAPSEIGSAGSFFMNPVVPAPVADALKQRYPSMPSYPTASGDVKLSAGWLIEQCGWKQSPHEHVGVYQHQALVVINRGGATGRDVLDFAAAVVKSVKEKFGVELCMEVNVIA